ncbi:hypothetical protein IX46_00875 [Buchnera aphidicola (Aphis glycines)]|uniref:Colicin V production protein n=1 Tax=Buchnera aphidicola (Aphis glycines) TaxID=1265350 RepID=A0A0M4H4C6_9GAMM|nr:hypothetical protein IX46_00875 [Buchnera aphidicola (Aphis glycines)]
MILIDFIIFVVIFFSFFFGIVKGFLRNVISTVFWIFFIYFFSNYMYFSKFYSDALLKSTNYLVILTIIVFFLLSKYY